jgi:heat shock protein 5
MVKEAEQYKAQDDALGEKIEAKNRLESFVYSMKTRVKEAKPDDAISETFKTTLEETERWLDENGSTATKEELEEKLKALQSGAPPPHDGPSGMPSGMPSGAPTGKPTVEDID